MTLINILLLSLIIAISFQFWRLRGISESIISFAKHYCKKEGLQYIALARIKTRPGVYKGQLDWRITYSLHFSSDGENEYVGKIETIGKSVFKVDLPVFRMVNID